MMRSYRIFALIIMLMIFTLNGLPGDTVGSKGVIRMMYAVTAFERALSPLGFASFLIPMDESAEIPENADKLVHFTIYFILSIFFFRGFFRGDKQAVALWLFAIADELQQIPVMGRSFSLLDLMFDTLGIIFVYYLLDEKHKN
ncbi:VanZ family protein [bacterium]|nr:VanZ family protein [bacterium]